MNAINFKAAGYTHVIQYKIYRPILEMWCDDSVHTVGEDRVSFYVERLTENSAKDITVKQL